MTARQTLETSVILDDKYRIERVIGAGGFGITYEAEHVALQRRVAIKEFFPEQFAIRTVGGEIHPRTEADRPVFEHMRLGFLKEARAVSRFEHPAITRILGVFEGFGTVYIVMRYEDGPSLKAWLQQLGRRPTEAEIDGIAAPLLDALEFIHGLGFLHRDIAPDNILLRPDLSPVLIDFGAARPIMTAVTATITGIVKRGFSPPEQYSTDGRSQGPWTDIYALAGTLYQCVTGKPPLEATQRLLGDEFQGAAETMRGSYRAGLLKAIDQGLAVQPRDRPQTIAEWRALLFNSAEASSDASEEVREQTSRRGLDARPASPAGAAPPSGVSPSTVGRSAAALMFAGAASLLAIAAAAWVLQGPSFRPSSSEDRPVSPSVPRRETARADPQAGPPSPTPAGPAVAAPAGQQAPPPATTPRLLVDIARGTFRDCPTCPEMLAIPAGSFLMGSPASEAGHQANEAPQQRMTVPRPFAIARFETTRGEWRAFSDATARPVSTDCRALQFRPELIADYESGRARAEWAATGVFSWANTNFPQDDTHPVACMSFPDAEAYLAWLSRRTDGRYRLPSEAEWEYAARAGTTTPFSFGTTVSPADANYHYPSAYSGGESGSWRRGTMPVGSFAANRFGLQDVHGNVWEWVADCSGASLADLDTSGRPHVTTPCDAAVMRGGAFWTQPEWIRSAHRYAYTKALRGAAAGFRSARDVADSEIETLHPLLDRVRSAPDVPAKR